METLYAKPKVASSTSVKAEGGKPEASHIAQPVKPEGLKRAPSQSLKHAASQSLKHAASQVAQPVNAEVVKHELSSVAQSGEEGRPGGGHVTNGSCDMEHVVQGTYTFIVSLYLM